MDLARTYYKEISEIVNCFVKSLSPKLVYLFGSYARGDYNENSDYDFYIVMSGDYIVTHDTAAKAYESIYGKSKKPVDILVNNEIEFEKRSLIFSSFEKTVKDEGIIVYETEKNRSIELDTDGLNWPAFRKRKVIQQKKP